MNRARQAEITQEILEVVAGADALTGYVKIRDNKLCGVSLVYSPGHG